MARGILRLVVFLLLVFFAGSCGDTRQPKPLRVGFVPSQDAQQVIRNAQPIVELLQQQLGVEVQPFVATDYTGVIEALRANKLDIAFLTAASYVLAKDETNVKVILKTLRRGSLYYYAAIITRTDSGIHQLEDLRGRTFAFGDPLSTSASIFPLKMLHEHGIDPARDFKRVFYSGGHDATVLAVLNGKVDAGATFADSPDGKDTAWMRYLKNPEDVKKIRTIAVSEPIPTDNLVVNPSLDESIARKIEQLFLNLSQDPKGKQMLQDVYQIDGFVRASDEDYDSVRRAFAMAGIRLKEALRKKQP
jgi:phosphonate transport system substrate-binding protein